MLVAVKLKNHQSQKSRGVCRGVFVPTVATPSSDGLIRQKVLTRLIPKIFPAIKSMVTQIEFHKCVLTFCFIACREDLPREHQAWPDETNVNVFSHEGAKGRIWLFTFFVTSRLRVKHLFLRPRMRWMDSSICSLHPTKPNWPDAGFTRNPITKRIWTTKNTEEEESSDFGGRPLFKNRRLLGT